MNEVITILFFGILFSISAWSLMNGIRYYKQENTKYCLLSFMASGANLYVMVVFIKSLFN